MKRSSGLRSVPLLVAASIAFCSTSSHAGVTGVAGESQVRITQFHGTTAVQSDFSTEIVPSTKPEPPAIARGRLDRVLANNDVVAAGQGVAIMYAPNLSGSGNPNDIGIDVGAFTDGPDKNTSWVSTATVKQTRSLLVSPGELGLQFGTSSARIRNRILLSGIMIVSSEELTRDLTGVDVHFAFNLFRRQDGRDVAMPISGEIALVGGPGGSVTVQRRAGALNNIVIPVIDLNAAIPSSPLVKAILFDGAELFYEYDVTLNQPYELELSATATVKTVPGGVGALATFGTPSEGLASIFDRVKKDDSGQRLIAAINQRVDTTGLKYVNNPAPFPGLSSMCGSMGTLTIFLMFVGGCTSAARIRRRRRSRGG